MMKKFKLEKPSFQKDSAKDYVCYPAREKEMNDLGYPQDRPVDWKNKAVRKLKELVNSSRSLKVFLETCVNCGACTDQCHYYLGTGDPKNMPVARQDLLRRVYKKHFTLTGKIFGKWVGAEDLSEELLQDWYRYFYQCSECRRCAVFCPYGIDTAEITMAARNIMNSIGMGQRYTLNVLSKAEKIGNNLGITPPALRDTLSVLEEDLEEETGKSIRIPLDEEGSEILFVTPSADLFSEPHIFSFMGYAKVFHLAGVKWTLSSYASEFANFGLFIGDEKHLKEVASRIGEEAKKLGVKRIVVGECGHAWRVAYQYWNTLIGPLDFLEDQRPVHICEYTLDLIQRGILRVDPNRNRDYIVSFHDSCNVARGSSMGKKSGGQFSIPRALVDAVSLNRVEMPRETTCDKTFCCGAGGGLLSDEILELRVKGASPRIQSLKKVVEEKQVNYLACICAICKTQFSTVFPRYGLPRDMVGGVHQLVSRALLM